MEMNGNGWQWMAMNGNGWQWATEWINACMHVSMYVYTAETPIEISRKSFGCQLAIFLIAGKVCPSVHLSIPRAGEGGGV